MKKEIKGANEAVALAVLHSGVSDANAYPGTPSTEIMTYIIKNSKLGHWTSNEKVSLETALGVSYVGGRAFISMKHVGLNAAADPLLSGSTFKINGGVVIVVADDPSMYSSQNEQDSRYYADFARIPCLEPSTVQESYDMVRDAFEISEELNKPVIVKMTTRLSHSKDALIEREPLEKIIKPLGNPTDWNSVPAYSKKSYARSLSRIPDMEKIAETSKYNTCRNTNSKVGVITTGIAKEHYLELKNDLSHLHIGAYPIPQKLVQEFAKNLDEIIVIEEGYPYVERYLRGLLPTKQKIKGKVDGTLNFIGEMTTDAIRVALNPNYKIPEAIKPDFSLVGRPPQLCTGCPHGDSFKVIKAVVEENKKIVVNGDIGCYSLGTLPPYNVPMTLVEMGSSIGMGIGSAICGKDVIAVIGDGTFIHSGMTSLVDCVANNLKITIIILDNQATAMTGGQPQILPSQRLAEIIKAIGVDAEHVKEFIPLPTKHNENVALLKQELAYNGVSVLIGKRECMETLRKRSSK
ncbi:MAG: hypothetical protein LBT02_01975 [Rickettsiales bacterium]|nr:hypothetical protein [Rickettsiales bacterium]